MTSYVSQSVREQPSRLQQLLGPKEQMVEDSERKKDRTCCITKGHHRQVMSPRMGSSHM